ncbi:DUF1492 domain-containing protein [Paenibacillus bovis]|uniref:Uncharacterized protein n=1 Tax=Paenibacillus bovis TaxID=1616788 RepID=A0A1X9T4C7_9BACL|nr:DUF1492 domain-containing protein [Paenibacillus bovis]ARR10719.1 hypothetical protein AR543_p0111 [Paenibacillus bovis]
MEQVHSFYPELNAASTREIQISIEDWKLRKYYLEKMLQGQIPLGNTLEGLQAEIQQIDLQISKAEYERQLQRTKGAVEHDLQATLPEALDDYEQVVISRLESYRTTLGRQAKIKQRLDFVRTHFSDHTLSMVRNYTGSIQGSGGFPSSPAERAAFDHMRTMEEMECTYMECEREIMGMSRAIDHLNPKERQLLLVAFVEARPAWKQTDIYLQLKISRVTFYRRKKRALLNLAKQLRIISHEYYTDKVQEFENKTKKK